VSSCLDAPFLSEGALKTSDDVPRFTLLLKDHAVTDECVFCRHTPFLLFQ
jgi:hypothetical protein